MSKRPTGGRASIFRGKKDGVRVQGVLTKDGGTAFEAARRKLAKLFREAVGRAPKVVSDADVIEYLAIGEYATRSYLLDVREREEARQ